MFQLLRIGQLTQWVLSVASIIIVSFICYITFADESYKTVALILMLNISILAMLCSIWPVLVSAILSAGIWNFFFIPPTFTFAIQSTEDTLMFLMYFVIALINTVLSIQIHRERKKLQKKEEEALVIKLYDTVFNSLSHELKTPISAIQGAVDILENKEIELSQVQIAELIHEIGIANERLNQQVSDLLFMSRIESGVLKPNLTWVDLNETIHLYINHIVEKNRIQVDLKSDFPLIKTDQTWLQVILQNLLRNALEYSDTDVVVRAKITNSNLVLEILDQGPGIPIEDRENVFHKFHRLPNANTKGTGIGLSLVKGYIEALKGSVSIADNYPKGANFICTLPVEINNYANE